MTVALAATASGGGVHRGGAVPLLHSAHHGAGSGGSQSLPTIFEADDSAEGPGSPRRTPLTNDDGARIILVKLQLVLLRSALQ